ncbi:hypothetical protein Tco_0657603 [Tanacetum coccineum]
MADGAINESVEIFMQGVAHLVNENVVQTKSSLARVLELASFGPNDVVVALFAREKENVSPPPLSGHVTASDGVEEIVAAPSGGAHGMPENIALLLRAWDKLTIDVWLSIQRILSFLVPLMLSVGTCLLHDASVHWSYSFGRRVLWTLRPAICKSF